MAMSKKAVALFMMMALFEICFGVDYNVGESDGWTIGVHYDKWASTKKFQVGDTLVFNYNTMFHNVLQVTQKDYVSCNLNSPVATFASGRDSIILKTAGHSYFVCGFPGHCQAGLKVDISVSASSSPSPDVPSPPSTPTATPPPPPQTPSAPDLPNFQPPPPCIPNVPLPPGIPDMPFTPGLPNLCPPFQPMPQAPPFDNGASLYSSNLNAAILGVVIVFLLFSFSDRVEVCFYEFYFCSR